MNALPWEVQWQKHFSCHMMLEMPTRYFVLALTLCFSAHAGICNDGSQSEPRHEFRVLGGYSPDSPTLLGTAEDRKFIMIEASYSYRCWSWEHASLAYSAGVVPAAIVRQPTQFERVTAGTPGNVTFVQKIPPHAVYGFGILPIGVHAEFARHHRLYPVAEANGGVVASTEPIPERANNATGLNFMFDGGAGLRWNAAERHALTFGYRWVHISNAETTSFNPGLDNNVFYVSYSFLK
jgi:hypothetical protein